MMCAPTLVGNHRGQGCNLGRVTICACQYPTYVAASADFSSTSKRASHYGRADEFLNSSVQFVRPVLHVCAAPAAANQRPAT